MKIKSLLIILLALNSNQAFSTSRVEKANQVLSIGSGNPSCLLQGEFEEVVFSPMVLANGSIRQNEFQVSWKINIEQRSELNSGECPAGTSFILSVREGRMVRLKNGQQEFRYPPDLFHPPARSKVRIQIIKGSEKNVTEWIVTDWQDGFKVL